MNIKAATAEREPPGTVLTATRPPLLTSNLKWAAAPASKVIRRDPRCTSCALGGNRNIVSQSRGLKSSATARL
jgi:hypothetical protein